MQKQSKITETTAYTSKYTNNSHKQSQIITNAHKRGCMSKRGLKKNVSCNPLNQYPTQISILNEAYSNVYNAEM